MTGTLEPPDGEPARLARMRECLRSLAVAGEGQQGLFPGSDQPPGTLASAFERSVAALQADVPGALSDDQRDAVHAVRRALETMSRDGTDYDADLWTEAALRTSEQWADVRRLAAAALERLEEPGGHRVSSGSSG